MIKNISWICLLLLIFSSSSYLNLATTRIESYPIEVEEKIPDTLRADTLYKGKLSYMHFKPENRKPDTFVMPLITDSIEYSSPVGGKITSGYGWRRQGWHGALDIGYNNRDTVRSIFNGYVRWCKYGYNGGYGNLIIVRHQNGLETYYAHFRKLLVEEGDTIINGTPIGIVGSTGNSLGPHLHLEFRFLGSQMNPNEIIDIYGDSLYNDTITLVLDGKRYKVEK